MPITFTEQDFAEPATQPQIDWSRLPVSPSGETLSIVGENVPTAAGWMRGLPPEPGLGGTAMEILGQDLLPAPPPIQGATPGGRLAAATLLNAPFAQIGAAPVQPLKTLSPEDISKPVSETVAGAVNLATAIPRFINTPLGLLTLGTGTLPAWAAKSVPYAFLPSLAASGGTQLGEASVTGDLQKAIEGSGSLLMAGATTLPWMVKPEVKPSLIPTRDITADLARISPPEPTIQPKGLEYATQERPITEGRVGEYPGVPQRTDVPTYRPEVREGESAKAGDSGRAAPSGTEQVSKEKQTPQEVAQQLGVRYDGEAEGWRLYTLYDRQGRSSTTITVKADAPISEIIKKYKQKIADYGDNPNAPRPIPSKPVTAEQMIVRKRGSTSPEEIESMPPEEFKKLVESKVQGKDKRKWRLTEDASKWAMNQKPENAPALIQKLTQLQASEYQKNLKEIESGNMDIADKSQWYGDAIHVLKNDDIGQQLVQLFKKQAEPAAKYSSRIIESKNPLEMTQKERDDAGWIGPVFRGTRPGKSEPGKFFTDDYEYAKSYSSIGGYSGSYLRHEPSKVSYGLGSKVESYYIRNPKITKELKPWGMKGEATVFETTDAVKIPSEQYQKEQAPAKQLPPPPEPPKAPAIDESMLESVTALEPSSGVPLSGIDALINKLEALKMPESGEGRLYSLPHPDAIKAIGQSVWNTALDTAIAAIKAGRIVRDAVSEAISYIKKNAKNVNEDQLRKNIDYILREEKVTPRVEGQELKTRKSAERASVSPEIPEQVRQRIAQAPESKYRVQPQEAVEDTVSRMSDAELSAVPPSSNIYVASRLDLSSRLFSQGKLDEAYQVFKEVSKTGTDFGQNINQFKRLKGANPLQIVDLVNRGLKESGRDPLKPEQAQELGNLAADSIAKNKALDAYKDAWLNDPTDANSRAAESALKEADAADLAVQKRMNSYKVKTWPRMLKAFAQGNPLTPISHVANFLGNTLGAGMEAMSRGTAAQLDTIRSALTGKPRQIAVQPIRGPVEAGKGYAKGVSMMPSILAKGPGEVVKGETRISLHPLKAFRDLFAKNPDLPTVEGKIPFNERARLAVEGVFGVAPETMLRLLSAADKPAYLSARSRLIAEQLKLANVPKSDWSFAQKFPELFLEKDKITKINNEAADAIFERPSKSVSYLQSLLSQYGDWGDLAFTIFVSPYKLIPWNLVRRTLQYNPLWAAAETAYHSSKGNIRAAELASGRMAVGGMLYTAGYFLYKNGLIGPSLDTRDESQKMRLLSGEVLPPNHVNVSGLKRLLAGGSPHYQPGDETFDLTRGGGAAGAILTSVANIGRDFEKMPAGQDQWLPSLIKNSTLEQASFTINQSFLKGVTGLIDAVRDRNIAPYVNGVEQMMLNVASPNSLTTLSRATRKYMPDLKADRLDKDFTNVVRNRFGFAGLDDYLPAKRGLWGEPLLQTPEGRNAILYHFFDISKGKQVTDDPVPLELYDLWRRTADASVIPSLPTRQITIDKATYALEPEPYSRYSELIGKNRRMIADEVVRNPEWPGLTDEAKIKVLGKVYERGMLIGKALFWDELQTKPQPKPSKTGFALPGGSKTSRQFTAEDFQ